MEVMSRKRKLFVSAAIVAAMSSLSVMGTFAAFSATTANTGNQVTSGTVIVSDTDAGTGKLVFFTGDQTEGAKTARCIRVTYGGSLTAAAVKLYFSGVNAAANGKYSLQVERGSGLSAPAADMNCTGFTQSSTPFNANLDTFPSSYAAGIDGKAAAATWATSSAVDYRFTLTVNAGVVNGNTTSNDTGSFDFTWEARSS